jgi:hypothetical protein
MATRREGRLRSGVKFSRREAKNFRRENPGISALYRQTNFEISGIDLRSDWSDFHIAI